MLLQITSIDRLRMNGFSHPHPDLSPAREKSSYLDRFQYTKSLNNDG